MGLWGGRGNNSQYLNFSNGIPVQAGSGGAVASILSSVKEGQQVYNKICLFVSRPRQQLG